MTKKFFRYEVSLHKFFNQGLTDRKVQDEIIKEVLESTGIDFTWTRDVKLGKGPETDTQFTIIV